MRWHVRVYCEKSRDYRDFVLSRLHSEPEGLDDRSEHTCDADSDRNTPVQFIIEPALRLKPEQKAIIETDYRMRDGQLVIETV